MDQPKPFVITIVGPESSGKTTLARELAAKYDCPWVPEFAREYLEGLDRDYDQEDLFHIAEGQLFSIHQQLALSSLPSTAQFAGLDGWMNISRNQQIPYPAQKGFDSLEKSLLGFYLEHFGDEVRPLVIVDGGMLTLRIWAKLKYGLSIPIVEEALSEDVTSLYILCRPLLPWEQDPWREAPSILDRAWIYNQYLEELVRIQAK